MPAYTTEVPLRTKLLWGVPALTILLLMILHFRTVGEAELIGTYQHTYTDSGLGAETFTLKRDRTFDQVFVKQDGARITHTGTWEIEGARDVVLVDYLFVADPLEEKMERKPEESMWTLMVFRSFTGQVRSLEWGDEGAFAFEQVR